MITKEQIAEFVAQSHRVGDAGLTICSRVICLGALVTRY